jgi:Mg-chelatase subunit ChlD
VSDADERRRRWRLVLGGEAAAPLDVSLGERDRGMDGALAALYESGRTASLGGSAPDVARWLGDIRTYFPAPVVRVMQQDALERLNLQAMLLQPELLAQVEPDIHLVATLIALNRVIPARTRETAREVVRKLARDLEGRLANPLRQAVNGALSRAVRNRRPRLDEIDWDQTIRANLRHYQVEHRTVIPETLIGFGRRRTALRDVVLAIDQSGSMATSVVYASICGAVLASLPALRTRLIVFDTAVVDLTDHLRDPVDLLFGVRLGGGTDIARALAYAQSLVTRPRDTVLVLVSDLHEGGVEENLLRRAASLVQSGVRFVVLLALSDQGRPAYDHDVAASLHALGVPAFACTPDLFPDLMAATLSGRDLTQWAAARELV